MPPGIGNTGLGTAVANVIIKTSSMQAATQIGIALGKQITAGQAAAAASINRTIAVQQQQTATMKQSLQVLNANIAAYKAYNNAATATNSRVLNGMIQQQAAMRQNIANQVQATSTLRNSATAQGLLTNKTQESNRAYAQATTDLLAMGAAAAIVFNTGVNAAGFLEQQQVAFASIAGSLEGGIALVNRLKKASADLKIPFNETVMAVRTILPTMEGNTDQLEKQLDIMRRLVSINPIQGMSGAGFSINEYMVSGGGDPRSLRGRFNIPSGILADELKKSSGDMWKALDTTLDRMRVTTEMADQMGMTFVNSMMMAKDATVQLMAEGFDPLIKKATPKLLGYSEWIQGIKQSNKESVIWYSSLVAIAAIATPIISLLGRWVGMMKNVVTATLAAAVASGKWAFANKAAIATGGVYAGAAVVGAYAGKFIGNQVQRATGQKESTWSEMSETAMKLLFIIVTGIVENAAMLGKGLLLAVAGLLDFNAALRYALADLLDKLGLDSTGQTQKGDEFTRASADTRSKAYNFGSRENIITLLKPIYENMFVTNNNTSNVSTPKFGSRVRSGGMNTDQQDTVFQYFQDLDSMTSKHYSDVVDAERQFGQQRADTVAQYGQQMVREEEDFQRSRLRAEQDFTRSVELMNRDSSRQEAEWNQDLADTLAEINIDSNDELKEIQTNYNKDREERDRQHKNRLMEAAAMLDAKAVWEEQNSYSEANRKAEDDYNDQLSKESEKRAERIQDEIDSHDKRIAESRLADAQRLSDMQENFTRQKALEDEDRAIKLVRSASDHAQQLTKMDIQQAEKMLQIDKQFIAEKIALEQKFREELKSNALFGTTWLKNQQMWQDEAIRRFGLFFKDITDTMLGKMGPLTEQEMAERKASSDNQIPSFITSFSDYIPLPETIIKPPPERFTKSVNVNKGAIVVNTSTGMSEEKVGNIIMEKLMLTFEYVGS